MAEGQSPGPGTKAFQTVTASSPPWLLLYPRSPSPSFLDRLQQGLTLGHVTPCSQVLSGSLQKQSQGHCFQMPLLFARPPSLHIGVPLPRMSFPHLLWATSTTHQDSANRLGDAVWGACRNPWLGQEPFHAPLCPGAPHTLLVQLLACLYPLLVCNVLEGADSVLFALDLLGPAQGKP